MFDDDAPDEDLIQNVMLAVSNLIHDPEFRRRFANGYGLTPEEADDLVAQWRASRQ
jgi:hypothetical protein